MDHLIALTITFSPAIIAILLMFYFRTRLIILATIIIWILALILLYYNLHPVKDCRHNNPCATAFFSIPISYAILFMILLTGSVDKINKKRSGWKSKILSQIFMIFNAVLTGATIFLIITVIAFCLLAFVSIGF
jgi:hypothetical protein